MSGSYSEDTKIPFDLDDCVSVNLFTLKNVITFMMNKVNKNSKFISDLMESNNELKKKVADYEKSMLENKTETDIVKNNTNGFIEEQKGINRKYSEVLADKEK